MVQKEVQELKEISKIIDNGLYNIALAKAVRGEAYMGEAVGENMVDVGKWQYMEFIHKITSTSIITNTYATFLSLATDMGLKSIKEKFYKK